MYPILQQLCPTALPVDPTMTSITNTPIPSDFLPYAKSHLELRPILTCELNYHFPTPSPALAPAGPRLRKKASPTSVVKIQLDSPGSCRCLNPKSQVMMDSCH